MRLRAKARRLVSLAVGVALALTVVGCDPGPPAPRPVPPTSPAPPGTVRAELEQWVGAVAYPWILGRAAATPDTLVWGDRLVRGTAAGVGLSLGASPEARRGVAGERVGLLLERQASTDELTFWAAWLADHSVDQLDSVVGASSEARVRHADAAGWLDHLGVTLLGRPLTTAERNARIAALAAGTRPSQVTADLVRSTTARRWAVAETYRRLGLALPTGGVRDLRIAQLRSAGGNQRVLAAAVAAGRAPARVRAGVVGGSVGFDLYYRAGGPNMATSIVIPVAGAGRIGCGVLAGDAQYQVLGSGPTWHAPADGQCPGEVAAMESALLDRGVEVIVWQIGAWETIRYRTGAGVVLQPRSSGLRSALVAEMVRRIDRFAAGGVRRVLLPEWACVGPLASSAHRDPGHSAFIRTVLDAAVAARPAMAAIAPTPPQVCVDGNPRGTPTREHRAARGNEYHWVSGPGGATWGWANWFAPAVVDLPGLR